jgi:hypothetical protein
MDKGELKEQTLLRNFGKTVLQEFLMKRVVSDSYAVKIRADY